MSNLSPAPLCNRQIIATNRGSDDLVGGKGNSVTVTVKDTCPECDETHLDFSVGAWNILTNSAAFGTINIDWHVLNSIERKDSS